nr:23S rRNA (adenine(2503)-C(2))-methyltransferase RlmN [bacterium]
CLSLHAPDDITRKRIMPGAAARAGVHQVLDAAREYVRASGRRLIVEYTLIEDVNDSDAKARQLAALLRGLQCHVNLIALNAVPGKPLRAPEEGRMAAFAAQLSALGISNTRRRKLGDDVSGACGQLRRQTLQERGKGQ